MEKKHQPYGPYERFFKRVLDIVDHITFLDDVKIAIKTVIKVLSHENIADVTESTMDENRQLHFMVDGVDYILHQPLNVERGC